MAALLGSTGSPDTSRFQALSAGKGRKPWRLAPLPRAAPLQAPAGGWTDTVTGAWAALVASAALTAFTWKLPAETGAVLLTLGRPDSAVAMLEKAVALEREFDAKDLMSETFNGLARAYQLTGRQADARATLNESLAIARELKDGTSECAALALLGRTELAEGRAAEAIRLCGEGLRIAERVKVLAERGENCQCLYLAYKAKGDGLAAVRYLEAYDSVQDSLAGEKTARELTQRDLLYTFGKQQLADSLRHAAEQERIKGEAERKAAAARTRYLFAGGAALLVMLGLLGYFISDRRRRRARFEKDAAQLETQALRSQMNPHFIFNALNSINAFVQRNDGPSASAYLAKFARLMRLVLENSRQAEVPLKDDLEALDLYLNLERARSRDASGAEKFDYTIAVDPDIDQEETLVPPFVENAIWHGMAGKEGKGHITLNVARSGDDLVLAIEDDGAGRQAKKAAPPPAVTPDGAPVKKTSLGTTITKARLDLVSKQRGRPAGFRYIDLPQGTRVEVRLPVSA